MNNSRGVPGFVYLVSRPEELVMLTLDKLFELRKAVEYAILKSQQSDAECDYASGSEAWEAEHELLELMKRLIG